MKMKIKYHLPSNPSEGFGFPPRPSGILLLSMAFLSDFLSFDPKIDNLEDLVGVSAFAESFSTVPFSLSFTPTPSFVSLPPPTPPSLGDASSSRDLKESPAEK